ncbi:MAG: hypothetical protein GDA54_04220 [Alphaproteobacteria bacterium GM7ARS4]|nr:hypothetical protein [Alphaproteobacteria bacterium GM7ARS4]
MSHHLYKALASLTLCILPLHGCSFTPLYGTHSHQEGSTPLLTSIAIAHIPERQGQILRTYLEQHLSPYRQENTARYELIIQLKSEGSFSSLESDATFSRTNVAVQAAFMLRDIKNNKIIFRNTRTLNTSYDYLQQAYANVVSAREYKKRLLKKLAESISLSVHGFMKKHTRTAKTRTP